MFRQRETGPSIQAIGKTVTTQQGGGDLCCLNANFCFGRAFAGSQTASPKFINGPTSRGGGIVTAQRGGWFDEVVIRHRGRLEGNSFFIFKSVYGVNGIGLTRAREKSQGTRSRAADVRRRGVSQHHGVPTAGEGEVVKNPSMLHEPGDEVEIRLVVLNTIIQSGIGAGCFI